MADGNTLRPIGLNHLAYPTWDTGETMRFYTEVLGCELVAAVREEKVPSTGAETPFLHTFFQMRSGECLAFFEVDEMPPAKDDGVPSWVRHVALSVESMAELDRWMARLEEHGVDYIGPIDHEGIWKSIYFFDPNDIRVELTYQTTELDEEHKREAEELIETWMAERGQTVPS